MDFLEWLANELRASDNEEIEIGFTEADNLGETGVIGEDHE